MQYLNIGQVPFNFNEWRLIESLIIRRWHNVQEMSDDERKRVKENDEIIKK